MNKHIAVIGYGNMGSAIAKGIKLAYPKTTIGIFEKDPEKRDKAKKEVEAEVYKSYKELFAAAEITIIAIKPQDLEPFFSDAKSYTRNKHLISIVAGEPTSYFQEHLKTRQVVRFMPNLAASVLAAAVGVSVPGHIEEEFKEEALAIARAIGTPYEIPENLMAAFTGLSGSGVAWVFTFIHAMALGGATVGISYNESLKITFDTILGAVKVLEHTGEHPVSMVSRVISPAGTTLEGLRVLESRGFSGALMEAIVKATERAEALARIS